MIITSKMKQETLLIRGTLTNLDSTAQNGSVMGDLRQSVLACFAISIL